MDLIIDNKLIDADIELILNTLKSELGTGLFSDVRNKGDNIQCTCPIHKNGHEHKPSCSIYNSTAGRTQKGWVHCFTCGYNVPLYRMIADVFHEDDRFGKDWLISRFGNTVVEDLTVLDPITLDSHKKDYLDETVLDQYRFHSNYWLSRGVSDEVAQRFEVGFDPEHDMVVFPIRDERGQLSMLTKRSTHTKFFQIDENKEKPVYLLYYCIRNAIDKVIVCESQINCLTAWTWGYPAIALIGTGSKSQYKTLRRSGIRQYILAFDGDKAGRAGAQRFIENMPDDVLITTKILPDGKDVNDLTKEQFDDLIEI